MGAHLAYLVYLVKHKWYVFLECVHAGYIWRGIIHDWSKFLPSEWGPYVRCFYRGNIGHDGNDEFNRAWLKHQHRCDHHWQHWCLLEDDGGIKPLSMSHAARTELLCDWRGAARIQDNNLKVWYNTNKDNMKLHPDTRHWIEANL